MGDIDFLANISLYTLYKIMYIYPFLLFKKSTIWGLKDKQ